MPNRLRACLLVVLSIVAGGTATADALQPMQSGYLLPSTVPLPEFRLQTHDGREFTRRSLHGRWTLLSIGYTHCPDVCPATLTQLRAVLARARETVPAGSLPRVVLLTVDPRRDDTTTLRRYVNFFGPQFTGVTGPPREIDRVVSALRAKYERVPGGTPDDYYVDHTATVSLIGPDARLRAVFQQSMQVDVVARDLRAIVAPQEK